MARAHDRSIWQKLRQPPLELWRHLQASPPHHGKVVLSFPGGYHHFPAPGYLGDDSFTLKICGTVNGGFEGCADLLFGVNVLPSGA